MPIARRSLSWAPSWIVPPATGADWNNRAATDRPTQRQDPTRRRISRPGATSTADTPAAGVTFRASPIGLGPPGEVEVTAPLHVCSGEQHVKPVIGGRSPTSRASVRLRAVAVPCGSRRRAQTTRCHRRRNRRRAHATPPRTRCRGGVTSAHAVAEEDRWTTTRPDDAQRPGGGSWTAREASRAVDHDARPDDDPVIRFAPINARSIGRPRTAVALDETATRGRRHARAVAPPGTALAERACQFRDHSSLRRLPFALRMPSNAIEVSGVFACVTTSRERSP